MVCGVPACIYNKYWAFCTTVQISGTLFRQSDSTFDVHPVTFVCNQLWA